MDTAQEIYMLSSDIPVTVPYGLVKPELEGTGGGRFRELFSRDVHVVAEGEGVRYELKG
jgi:hypothetical protein